MNIAIEQTEEYVNGQLKNKYGDAFLRGNNGMFLLFLCTTAIPEAIFSSFHFLCTKVFMYKPG